MLAGQHGSVGFIYRLKKKIIILIMLQSIIKKTSRRDINEKVLTITLVVFALFTLKSNAFAAAANVLSWEETGAKRSDQYYTLTAPIDYSNIQANPQSDIALLPW
jgi:hypothetical protein